MTERQYGIVATAIFHTVVLIILIFTFISMSKTVSSEGGILINFGDMEMAGGPSEPQLNMQQQQAAAASQQQAAPNDPEGIMTQDFEEAPAIKKPEAVKKTETKKAEPRKTETKPVTTTAVPKTPTVNKNALYSNKAQGRSTTESGTSEGIYKGQGNMGDVDGTPDSDNYTKGLGGDGIGFDLTGRSPLHLPKPAFTILKEGIVVVEIAVDRDGKVIRATAGGKGSTIVDNTLYTAAKKAALESKFNVKNDAKETQIGTISYHFKLE
jgi:outer membrane biosynthesis protein TonB